MANGTEGEPASAKDKVLLRAAPHLVLDGIEVVAGLLGATEAHLCVDRNWPDVLAAVDGSAARAAGLAAADPPAVVGAPDRYVAGEETALVHWLNGGEAKPTFVPPRVPSSAACEARPTFISNVETYANLALIARFGPAWYRALGTIDAPGTTLLTVTGGVARPGVCEAPGGSRLDAVIAAAGGAPARCAGRAGRWLLRNVDPRGGRGSGHPRPGLARSFRRQPRVRRGGGAARLALPPPGGRARDPLDGR